MWRKEFFLLPFMLFIYSTNQITNHGGMVTTNVKKKFNESQIFLRYEGTISGPQTIFIEQTYKIDAILGLRFDSELRMKNNNKYPVSHLVIYYEYANPNQCILYDAIKKTREVLTRKDDNDNSSDAQKIKEEVMYGYNCTHLRHVGGNKDVFDYWMSKDVPGYNRLINIISAIQASKALEDISTSIFKYGGIVKISGHAGDNSGVQLNLELTEALRDTSFLVTDFVVPSTKK